jgi:periplasmic divalent cation tolerance protein
MSGYGIVYTSTNSKKNARDISTALLNKKLAACIQSFPMSSTYEWQGEIVEDEELLMLIKIKAAYYDEVERVICETHDYDVAEVMMTDVCKGNPAYLDWISAVTC